jgi:hypothetical protein
MTATLCQNDLLGVSFPYRGSHRFSEIWRNGGEFPSGKGASAQASRKCGKKEFDVPEQISLLDLMELPAPLRRIVRMVLREISMTYSQILSALEKLPEPQRPDRRSTDMALHELTSMRLLIRFFANHEANYRVNLAYRTPHVTDETLWQKADFTSIERAEQQWQPAFQAAGADGTIEIGELVMRRGGKRTLPNAIWDSLDEKPREQIDAPDGDNSAGRGSLRNKLFGALDDL